ncbi:hypothetical protein HanHA300_Chr06g0209431 [Helianthus annuus]|nr:hypothetical protein HanHA300_Chr06g0209431 [Helianthus annuus]
MFGLVQGKILCNDCHITILPCYLKSMYQQRELYTSVKEKLKVTASYKHLLLLNSDTKSTMIHVEETNGREANFMDSSLSILKNAV